LQKPDNLNKISIGGLFVLAILFLAALLTRGH